MNMISKSHVWIIYSLNLLETQILGGEHDEVVQKVSHLRVFAEKKQSQASFQLSKSVRPERPICIPQGRLSGKRVQPPNQNPELANLGRGPYHHLASDPEALNEKLRPRGVRTFIICIQSAGAYKASSPTPSDLLSQAPQETVLVGSGTITRHHRQGDLKTEMYFVTALKVGRPR